MVKASVVCVDNGDPNLETCLKSLRNQSIKDIEIILCPGPKTDLELAKKYVDVGLNPTEGIGKARVKGILRARSNYIISCDSDSRYDYNYVRYALEDLRHWGFVKAGSILPLKPSFPGYIESAVSPAIPYEFALSLRKDVFLKDKIDKMDYEDPRRDIGPYILFKEFIYSDFRMTVWTRFPTIGGKLLLNNYSTSLVGMLVPGAVIGGIIGLNELRRNIE